jgi:hypothetical protein
MTIRSLFICLLMHCVIHFPLSATPQKNLAHQILVDIPSEDLEVLEEFFRDLLFLQGFAYTLFGDKPVSIENYDRDNPQKPDVFATSCKGYTAWKKYAHLFPQEHYIFVFHEPADKDTYEMTLINKKAFLQMVDKHKKKFSALLGPTITAEKLLSQLIQNGCLENTAIKNREDLIGILLGYGENNASLFQRRSEITGRISSIKRKDTTPTPGYCSTEDELKSLNARLRPFSNEQRKLLRYMHLPSFVADPNHQETIQLKKKYTQQRKQITQHFSHKNVLEMVFEQLSS